MCAYSKRNFRKIFYFRFNAKTVCQQDSEESESVVVFVHLSKERNISAGRIDIEPGIHSAERPRKIPP
jgi:hypothetical protein